MKPETFQVLALYAALAGTFSSPAQVTFTQITNAPIATDTGSFLGCAWGDYRNSGFQDLVVCNSPGTNAYYQNNGDGTFTRITQGNPVQDLNHHLGGVVGDYNNDGHLDLFISVAAFSTTPSYNQLFQNNGDGTFASVSGGVLTNQLGHFGPPSWADYDNDGFLDLFVPFHGVNNSNGDTNLLYHNNGDGTFSLVTSSAVTTWIRRIAGTI